MITLLIYFAIGSVGGFFSGFLGIGGGVILLPLMVYLARIPIKEATSISMWFVIFSSISGIVAHKKLGNIDLEIGLWLSGGSVVGSIIGTRVASISSDRILQIVFIGVLLAASVMLLVPSLEYETGVNLTEYQHNKKIFGLPIGLVQGVLTGILGIGGGFIIVPLMICVLRMKTIKAVGTSLLVMFLSAIVALVSKAMMNEFAWPGAAWMIILGGIIFAQLGSRVASEVSSRLIRGTLFILLLMIVGKMIYELIA